jgi:hypothetical protein
MGDGTDGVLTSTIHEYHGMGRMVLGEIGRGRGVRPAIARRAARRRAAIAASADKWELVACASGNLVLLYLTLSDDRIDREMIDEHYPDLIPGLLAHPGVGVILVHSAVNGPIVLGRSGEHHLTSGRVVGEDPLAVYGRLAVEGLTRLDQFRNAGDLTVIGPYDPESGEVISYEDLVGSHGGLGGRQGEPFLLHPVELPLSDGPPIGAPAVNAQLRDWLEILESDQPIAPAKQVEGPTSREDHAAHVPASGAPPVSDPGQPVGASRAPR